MGASAALQATEVVVAPGSDATVELRVRNTGTVVDQFTFQIIGNTAGWTSVEPPQVSLFPGAEETVRVTFRPPRAHTTLAGTEPFAVKVESREDPEGSVVEEGVVTVEPFDDRFAELIPRTSRGSRGGEHDLALDNKGNAASNVRITPIDADGQLSFDVDPPALKSEPGTAAFSKVRVKPQKKFWRGVPVTKPFKVLVEEEGKAPIEVDGAFLQEPLLPRWLWKALLALLALAILFAILWFTVLQPSIESTAKQVAQEEVAPVVSVVEEELGVTVPEAGSEGTGDGGPDGQATTTTAQAPPTTQGGGGGDLGDPFDFRLAASASVGGSGTASTFTVPAGNTFSLTDIVMQNPNGDSGRLVIARDGDPLFESSLENFRDLDYHFVSPYIFTEGQNLTVQITSCTVSGLNNGTCSAAVSFAGFVG
jgi:hypothetical protein